MKAILIEDNEACMQDLVTEISKLPEPVEIAAKLHSIAESVAWLSSNPSPDFIFSDVELEDGLSFSIFQQVEISAPVIFITIYEEYAIRAFDYNGVGYILKPASASEIWAAMSRSLKFADNANAQIKEMIGKIRAGNVVYREKVCRELPDRTDIFDISEVEAFNFDGMLTNVILKDGVSFSIKESLKKLEEQLDPARFFRVSRSWIVSSDSVKGVSLHFRSCTAELKSGLKVDVSRDRTNSFKDWVATR